MSVRSFVAPAVVVAVIGLVSCGGGSQRYDAATSVHCMRAGAASLTQPSRAAARESRYGPHRERIGFVVPSGTTTGVKASDGDYQLGIYPSEDILWLHFTRSNRELSTLMHGYRPRAYRTRNVIVEWDRHPPSKAQRSILARCLLTKRSLPAPRPWRPARLPTRYAEAVNSARLPLLDLVPKDAEVVRAWRIPAGGSMPPQVAIQWQRVSLAGSSLDTGGFVIWQQARRARGWQLVYSLPFPAFRVSFLYVRAGDVNGDRHAELLLFEDMGGSAGCGVYRLLATTHRGARQLLARRGCADNTRVRISQGSLVMYDGLVRDPRTLNQIHCCWTTWLRTTMRWRGSMLVSTSTDRLRPLPRHVLLSRF
jgi:hypothetical protein